MVKMKCSIPRIAGLVLMLAASPAAATGTASSAPQQAAAEARQTSPDVDPFDAEIGCAWHVGVPGFRKSLYARNTLTHTLPVGTRLSWTVRGKFDTITGAKPKTGSLVLTEPVTRSGEKFVGMQTKEQIGSCTMRAAYRKTGR